MVPAMVVPPVIPLAATTAKSLRDIFAAAFDSARTSISWDVIPTCSRPFIHPIVAGMAPLSRIIDSTESAVSKFRGKGMPVKSTRDNETDM